MESNEQLETIKPEHEPYQDPSSPEDDGIERYANGWAKPPHRPREPESWGGLMLYVKCTPPQHEGEYGRVTPSEWREGLIGVIYRCDHEPMSNLLSLKPYYNWRKSSPNTMCRPNNFRGPDGWKTTKFTTVVEYWFPDSFNPLSWERLDYVKNYWKWAAETNNFSVRFEIFPTIEEGPVDPRKTDREAEWTRRANNLKWTWQDIPQ